MEILDRRCGLSKSPCALGRAVERVAMPTIKLKLQMMCGEAIAIGPGKAELLEQIAATGSISAAARQLGMSYRRAWQLVDVMNRCWNGQIVATIPGRASGGAHLTELGSTVLARYRALQLSLDSCASQSGWQDMSSLIRDQPLASRSNPALPGSTEID